MRWKDEDWIYMAQVMDQWRGAVNVIMFFGFNMVRVSFLPGLETVGISRNILPSFFFAHEVFRFHYFVVSSAQLLTNILATEATISIWPEKQYVFLKTKKKQAYNYGSFICNRSNTFVGRLGLSAPPPVYPHSSPHTSLVNCPFSVMVPVVAHRKTVIIASM
jgi:hypothetical protein